jgi:membrane protease YdiL (CAAX protease family)
MNNPSFAHRIIHFPLTKMIIGGAALFLSVIVGEFFRSPILDKTQLTKETKDVIVAVIEISLALLSYINIFRFYEKRKIRELNLGSFWRNAFFGFIMALSIQSLVILVIFFRANYSIIQVNPPSFLLSGMMEALIAGFIAEIFIRGILFRLTEEKLGTIITLIIFGLLFAILHMGSKGANFLSVFTTTIQAGILVSLLYVYTRSLWVPIFFHFAWDFAEPTIYGGINPGIHVEKTLFSSSIGGPSLLTGGVTGPGNSLQAMVFCLLASLVLFYLAKKKKNFIEPFWAK